MTSAAPDLPPPDPRVGLTDAEAARRLAAIGPNRLHARPPRSAWRILRAQFTSLIVLLLAIGAVAAVASGNLVEAAAIGAVLALNGAIGFVMELRAVRSMEALRGLERTHATMRRGGRILRVPAEQLVPGDIVLVEGGDIVAADLRLLEASRLQADESVLTGEAFPVTKEPGPDTAGRPLAERRDRLFKGTAVTRGSAEGLVVATGMATELGQVTRLVAEAAEEETPLERRLGALGRRLVWVTLAVALAVVAAGLLRGGATWLLVETAVALAVAAVPEGLPVIATIALARGMHRLARRHAVVNRLAAVEALGTTTVILTDKTGTLTENRLVAERVEADGAEQALLEAGVLCNAASPGPDGPVGDPVDVALLALGERRGVSHAELHAAWPMVHEEAFDPDLRLMGTVHRAGDRVRVAVKGAFEAVARCCALDAPALARWQARHDALAGAGLRVLAVAERRGGAPREPYRDLSLLGLVGITDPPRADVAPALAACRAAGIRVIMATGDHPDTARAIASRVGFADDVARTGAELATGDPAALRRATLFARMSPADKLALLALHQAAGEVVAMTGDGVNDAPALTRADVGVAMGVRGTDVAREAADIVLRDDRFATIVAAIREGRVIVGNLRAFVCYLLSCNASEVAVIGLATLAGAPLPVLPLQILYLNLVTDVFPALALGLGEGDAGVMARPPVPPRAPLLGRRHWWTIAGYAGLLTASVLASQQLALRLPGATPASASSVAFLTLAFAQLWHVFNMRPGGSSPWRNAVTRNPWVWGALALCVPLVLATAWVPTLARVLGVVPPTTEGWRLVAACSVGPLLAGAAVRWGLSAWVARSGRG